MLVELLSDPAEFLRRAEPLFIHDPISTNVIATVTAAIDPTPITSEQPGWWALVFENDHVQGVAMLTPPWNLFLSRMSISAAASIADTLTSSNIELSGVTGASDAAQEFAERWCETHAARAQLDGRRRVYTLNELVEPAAIAGRARRFRADETPLAAEWWGLFHDEAVPADPRLDWLAVAEAHIKRNALWCWCADDAPVALAAVNTAGDLARIGPVFTPSDQRCNGYAAGTTAAAVRAGMAAGANHVMLYADAENATSNALYQRLGFDFDHDAEQYGFH